MGQATKTPTNAREGLQNRDLYSMHGADVYLHLLSRGLWLFATCKVLIYEDLPVHVPGYALVN